MHVVPNRPIEMSQPRTNSTDDRAAHSRSIKAEAKRLGFELVGIAPAIEPMSLNHFHGWLEQGFAGEMEYIPRREDAYSHPSGVLEAVRSVIMLGINYRTEDPAAIEPGQAMVSRYAWGEADYHDVLRSKLKQLSTFVHQQIPGCRSRGIVDTAPLLERDFARLAGLGWFGKNTMLINKRAGSWMFLAALLVDFELEYDQAHETSHCGTCTRCLDACPTDAFPAPSVLDARKCISYLTIELQQPVPIELRSQMGNWLYGCDICQDVCPWNNKAPISTEPAFQPVEDLRPADAASLLGLNDEQFRARFRRTPLWRAGRAGLLRNAALVLGNSGNERVVPILIGSLEDSEELVRGAAAWALGRLGGEKAVVALHSRSRVEDNADVKQELQLALSAIRRQKSHQETEAKS